MSKGRNGDFLTSAAGAPQGVAKYLAAARAPGTVTAYAKAYAAFSRWCEENGCDAADPDNMTIARYLATIAEGMVHSTVKWHLTGIIHSLKQSGHLVDPSSPLLRDTLQGIERFHRREERRSMALMLDDIRALVATCEDHNRGVRDKALILVGFAGAFRRNELVFIDIEHLKWTPDGLNVLVPRSKEDQVGKGESVFLPYGSSADTCPVLALRAWLDRMGNTSGPVFRPVRANGQVRQNRLIDKQVNRIIVERAALAGLAVPEGRGLSSHSLRAGFITEAYRAGLSDEEIMGHTRHRDIRRMRGYVRRERLHTISPAGRIGL